MDDSGTPGGGRVPLEARPDRIPPGAGGDRGVVLVTGATTGIGLVAGRALARSGFHVIGTARHLERAGELLETSPPGSVTLLRLDVTDQAQIDEAALRTAEMLREAGIDGLAGLVNNAGVALIGPIETVPVDQLREQFEVNVFGQVALTQALLPLLRARRGRIVNIGSVAAWITMPFLGPLAASKAAFRSLNDALRLELRPAGIQVVLLEPGRINSAAPDKLLRDLDTAVDKMSADHRTVYADGFRTMIGEFVRRAKTGRSPETVADAVVRAFTAARPRSRQPIGATARRLGFVGRVMPNAVLDRVRYRLFGLTDFAREERH